jgi:hypothetical protein
MRRLKRPAIRIRVGVRLSQEALTAAVADEKIGTLDHLKLVRAGLHRAFQLALSANDFGAISSLARALDENILQGAKLAGEWQEGPRNVTNVAIMALPGVAGIISGITKALVGEPTARKKIIEYLRTANGTTAALPAPEIIDAAAE